MSTPRPHYSTNPALFPLEGGCACGLVRYALDASPLCVHCCHCTLCQREGGGGFIINVLLEQEHFRLLPPAKSVAPQTRPADSEHAATGAPTPCNPQMAPLADVSKRTRADGAVEPLLIPTPTESGIAQDIARCPRCFVAVYSEYVGSGPYIKYVRGGTLDRAWTIDPDVHIFTRSRREFAELPPVDGRPQFDDFYDRREVWRPEALERYDKLKPQLAELFKTYKKLMEGAKATEEAAGNEVA